MDNVSCRCVDCSGTDRPANTGMSKVEDDSPISSDPTYNYIHSPQRRHLTSLCLTANNLAFNGGLMVSTVSCASRSTRLGQVSSSSAHQGATKTYHNGQVDA
jgi:hypothetical protein